MAPALCRTRRCRHDCLPERKRLHSRLSILRQSPLNNNPTLPERTNLLLPLDAIEQQPLNANDSVWFSFSGHGASQGSRDYLLPADGNPRLLEDTAIPIDRGIHTLQRCNAATQAT